MAIEVVPFDAGLGADVRGLDASRPVSAEDRDALVQAWFDHLVLRIRGRPLDDEQLITFSRNFGDLDFAPLSELKKFEGVRPEITVVSNILRDGKPIGTLGNAEASWHTDSSCDECPPAGSLLHALEVPEEGGNTHFINMYAVYDRLPQALKDRIAGKVAIHDASYTSAGTLRQGRQEVVDVTQAPGARHPLVRTHPGTGRKALFLGRRLNAYVVGLPIAESEALLDELWTYVRQPGLTWEQRWRAGDIVIWDNRCTMHRRDSFDPSTRRRMHRTQLQGDRPY